MLKNYIKIAFRNLFKNKVYSFINIFGLAVGIGCCLLIGMYVQNEWSFDTFHSKSDRIYRVWTQSTASDGESKLHTGTPIPLGPALREYIPEIEQFTYIYQFNDLVQTPDRPDALDENVLVINQDFFQMFDFNLVQGDTSSAFNNPSSVVITEETARRFFGDQDPMQKNLSIRTGGEFREFIVTGIIEQAPSNSSITYNMLIPDKNLDQLLGERARSSWFSGLGATYVLLPEDVDTSVLEEKLASMMRGILGEDRLRASEFSIGLQPLTDIHLNTAFPAKIASVSDPSYSYILAAIALFILLIACVNFMTLSISKSASRAKEVGIRKTIGAVRHHLMYQFWGEALLTTTFALVVGVLVAELLLPFFNDLSGTSLELSITIGTLLTLAVLAVLISLIAGIYPAVVLSGFRPVEVLKGRVNFSADKNLFQQSMVVMQFSLSIALIFGTITIWQQLNYIQNKNLGFQKDQVIVLESGLTNSPQASLEENIQEGVRRKELLESKLSSTPEVEDLAVSFFTTVQTAGWANLGFEDDEGQQRSFHGNVVDADFLPALGIKIIKGRNFSDEYPSDSRRSMIVNQAMVENFGWENPIGQRLPGSRFEDHEIIGVVENFNFESLHTPVEPLALTMTPSTLLSGTNFIQMGNFPVPRYSLKLNTQDLGGTMAEIKDAWEEVEPGTPFDFTFVDQALDAQYRKEQRISSIVTTAAVFAIIIACLGLFGLASLMIVRRTKEIGVRKVLGATSANIVLLVNKEFTKLVLIAFVIAVPVGWYFMSGWLKNFAYRIDIGLGIILLVGISALVVAWLTVSYQSIKAALVNPVDSLKSE
ncbi:MAG: ABC transporter permease [Balneolaceae bacterium]